MLQSIPDARPHVPVAFATACLILVACSSPSSSTEPASGDSPGADYLAPSPTAHYARRGDPRSASLRLLTRGWATDWQRHSIDLDELIHGGPPRDGIRPIDRPAFQSVAQADGWLAPREPVIALELNGKARAYALGILTHHEIVNDNVVDAPVAVTFCPLCNAAIVFDRHVEGRALTFGTSGLLRHSDLVMWDRQTESLWQQATGQAIVGELTGKQLTMLPSAIVSWADFKSAYPDGEVLSPAGSYGTNPYVGYDSGQPFLFHGPIDRRLPAVMRVVFVQLAEGAVAYPYDELARRKVVNDSLGGVPLAIFWRFGTASALDQHRIADSRDVGASGVFDRRVSGRTLEFEPGPEGSFVDRESGTTWDVLGRAIEGPRKGQRLRPVVHADFFWFAAAAISPDVVVYHAPPR